MTIRWMPSHLDLGKKKWPSDVTQLDVDGNNFADTFAGDAARLAEAPLELRTDVVYHYKLVRRIQKRIITIIQNLPPRQRKQNVLSKKELQPKVDDLALNSKHVVVHTRVDTPAMFV